MHPKVPKLPLGWQVAPYGLRAPEPGVSKAHSVKEEGRAKLHPVRVRCVCITVYVQQVARSYIRRFILVQRQQLTPVTGSLPSGASATWTRG